MAWVDDYKKKLVTAEEAVSTIKSQQRIYISGNVATPYAHGKNLQERTKALINIAHPKFRPKLIREAKERNMLQ